MNAIVPSRAFTLFRAGMFPLLAAVIAWRLPTVFAEGRLWAEEGMFYYARAWHLSALDALVALYSGYLNIIANLATLVASRAVALEHAPMVTAGIALLIQLLPALLLATASEPWLRRPAPLVAAMLLTVLPVRAGELWLNSITSHFHLMACVGLILALAPRTGGVGRLRLAVLLVAPMSGPGNAFLWPLFVLRAWRERSVDRWTQVVVMALGIAVQAGLVLAAPIENRPFGAPITVVLALMGLEHVVLPLLGGQLAAPLSHELYIAFEAGRRPVWIMALPVAVLGAMGLLAWRRADSTTLWLFLAGLWLAVVSYYTALTHNTPNVLLLGLGMRYAFAPTVLFGACLVGLAASTPAGWLRQFATGAVWWMLAVGTISYFDNPGFTTGPSWPQQVAAWRANPTHPIQLWPPGWAMKLEPRMR